MADTESQETVVVIRGKRCKVTAHKMKGLWKASGMSDDRLVEITNAATAAQAFEWWTNKAGMKHPDE